MWKALKFCVLAAVILALAWWVAGLPGEVNANAGDYQISTSTPVALLLVLAVLAVLIMLFRVLGGLRRAPGRFSGWRGGRRAQAGELALQRGLVAVAAGDASGAKAASVKARSLLGDTPFVQWLNAEAARLSGQTEQARLAFERLTQSKEMKFLGHQGLLRESLKAGRADEAAKQAEAAEEAYPGGNWTRRQRLTLAVRDGNYAAALRLTQEPQERTALAVAAAEKAETPKLALEFAKQAVKAGPTFPLAQAALARALRGLGKERAARKTLLKGWKSAPHPALAALWFTPGASVLERAQAAALLAAENPGHMESELLLSETALTAKLPGEARRHAEAALKAGNADGRAAAILAKLDGEPAPAIAPAWRCTACRAQLDEWSCACPACGKVGTLTPNRPSTALTTTEQG
ncbi:heme biosynthesis HemY N-terminal domain-containing protein [Acidocella sp.]|uniref:heme biosynthesis HemY N-terminal domain-containing protein n=1 Tax=Acidocella sp. TaxID=50710 RepID=UPI003CFEBE48